jgi:hypothetical protein
MNHLPSLVGKRMIIQPFVSKHAPKHEQFEWGVQFSKLTPRHGAWTKQFQAKLMLPNTTQVHVGCLELDW